MVNFGICRKTSLFQLKLLCPLFGQLLGNVWLLFSPTSGHTAHAREQDGRFLLDPDHLPVKWSNHVGSPSQDLHNGTASSKNEKRKTSLGLCDVTVKVFCLIFNVTWVPAYHEVNVTND